MNLRDPGCIGCARLRAEVAPLRESVGLALAEIDRLRAVVTSRDQEIDALRLARDGFRAELARQLQLWLVVEAQEEIARVKASAPRRQTSVRPGPFEIDMNARCVHCGKQGATPSGRCLKCLAH